MTDDLISRQAAIETILECCPSVCDNEYECGYDDGLRGGVHKLKHLPSAQQWIPVSERLPEENKPVLVTHHGKYQAFVSVDWIDPYTHEWNRTCNVTAWQPLPKPWEGADDDRNG